MMTATQSLSSSMAKRPSFASLRMYVIFVLLTLLITKEVSAQTDPCTNNELLELVDRGLRHPSNRISNERGNICDNVLDSAVWYKMTSAVSYRIPEYCMPTMHCGTVSPIWVNGTHPTASDPGPVTLPICAVGLDGACCGRWNGTVQVKYCPGNGPTDDFYVYLLQQVHVCDSAYCAATRDNSTTDVNECLINPCQNGGQCTNTVGSYTCDCATGFTGKNCYIDVRECDNNPCQNGGTCKNTFGSYTCDCQTGYNGRICENVDHCSSNPCRRHGTCVNREDGFRCRCVSGRRGRRCEKTYCSNSPCKNNGKCTNLDDGFRCQCKRGFKGKKCENDIRCRRRAYYRRYRRQCRASRRRTQNGK